MAVGPVIEKIQKKVDRVRSLAAFDESAQAILESTANDISMALCQGADVSVDTSSDSMSDAATMRETSFKSVGATSADVVRKK